MADYYKLVYEIADAPGSRMFAIYRTKEQAEEKLAKLLETTRLAYYEIVEVQ